MKTISAPPEVSLRQNHDIKIIGAAVLYYLAARLGYYLAFEDPSYVPTWPPSGIAFALTILFGRRIWPGITIGSLVASLLAFWFEPGIAPHIVIAISLVISIAYTIESIIGSLLLDLLVKEKYPFHNTKNAFRFLFVTVIMTTLAAVMVNWVLTYNGVLAEEWFYRNIFSTWIGNAVGILLFTPFILSVVQKVSFKLTWEKVAEVGIFLVFGVGIFFLLQIDYVAIAFQHALPFLVLPFLLWIAFRFNLTLASAGVLAASLYGTYLTVHQTGPLLLNDAYNTMLLLQIFMGVISISTIVLSATVTERRQAQQQLLELTTTLETKVHQRTRALEEEIQIRRDAEERMNHTNEELSKRNTELDNFVYSVSHDLRAPLASVLGLINLARHDKSPKMREKYLDMINRSALQQDYFIKEILDQSRNSRLEVRREPVNFREIIDEAFEQMEFFALEGDSIEKIIHVDQVRPFFSDRWRLKVIMNNIVSNAIRYRNGKAPVIRVTVKLEDRTANLLVEDNGKGIEKEHLPNLYKMFYRATDDGAGSGLGLYIVKETLEKLNGEISIESELHHGTTVRVKIPEINIKEG